jgi:hypothetical protein
MFTCAEVGESMRARAVIRCPSGVIVLSSSGPSSRTTSFPIMALAVKCERLWARPMPTNPCPYKSRDRQCPVPLPRDGASGDSATQLTPGCRAALVRDAAAACPAGREHGAWSPPNSLKLRKDVAHPYHFDRLPSAGFWGRQWQHVCSGVRQTSCRIEQSRPSPP